MLFEKQIYDYLRGMVSIPSVSNTPQEKEVSDYIAGCLERQPYLRNTRPSAGSALWRATVWDGPLCTAL